MSLDKVLAEAQSAKDAGASRFRMGAAWREPKDRDIDQVCAMIEGVRAMGLETCDTLGMLTNAQARRLKASGLDFTTTISTPRRNPMARSSRRAPTRSGSVRWAASARPAFMSAAAASSAWGRARKIA
jgi:hypothetical protein